MNSLQLGVVGASVRCQKSRQDTKTTRRRCLVEVRSQAWSESVELWTARGFPFKPRARNGVAVCKESGVKFNRLVAFRARLRVLG